jgi:transposase
MPKSHARYASEYRRRMVELVRAGRSPDELANELETTAQSIRNWVAQAERDAGRRLDGLTSEERQELARLRRENRVLRKSARYYQKPRPGSRRRPVRCRHGV